LIVLSPFKTLCSLAFQNITHFWTSFLLLWFLFTQSPIPALNTLLLILSISLGDFIVLKYHLYAADMPQLCVISLDFSSKIQAYIQLAYLISLLGLKKSKNWVLQYCHLYFSFNISCLNK
jgi:hypothetical protein